MTRSDPIPRRPQSPGEEIANSVSHGVGFVAILGAAPFLIMDASRRGGASTGVGASVFAATASLLYLTSVVYHALPPTRAKHVFRLLDHGAIFLLIAGTYTPFTLGVLRGAWGWLLFGLVWSLALAGIILKLVAGFRHPRLSMGLYLLMGWVALIAIKPLWLRMAPAGLFWLFGGGIFYTAGAACLAARHIRFHHLAWHLAVLAGTACHFVAVLHYA